MNTTTITRRKRTGNAEAKEPEQLFRSRENTLKAQLLLERHDLTDEDIRKFCLGEDPRPYDQPGHTSYRKRVEAYRRRRKELQELSQKGARVDEDGRLVLVADPAQPPAIDLPPPPPPRDDNAFDDLPRILPENDEEDLQWLQQQERAAAAAIARAVNRYLEQGVPAEDLQLIQVRPLEGERTSFTFRRICIAVLAVVTAFVCIMLQTLPLFHTSKPQDPTLDKLMTELLRVKLLIPHSAECPGLERENRLSWVDSFWNLIGKSDAVDCSDGVLHIPSQRAVIDAFLQSKSMEEVDLLEPFVTKGINASWFMQCQSPPNLQTTSCQASPWPHSCISPQGDSARCFRGVHDDQISEQDIQDILQLGASLIEEGGDHFDIYEGTTMLRNKLPTVVHTIQELLTNRYGVSREIQPIAFRINAVGPMDAAGVPLFGIRSSNSIVRLFNRTNYLQWMEKAQRRNEIARYSLPWPFRLKPVRDVCNLMADMEADPNFAIQSTVFLSNGAGEDYQGGVALYVDHHPSNNNPRRKIQRGMTIDGSRGRVVVSTGGLENRRCRLPTRAGIRASLQIWWTC
jgi:hypothetical protein